MKKTKINFLLAALICSLLLGGCFSPWKGEEEGTITINLGVASGRAAMPVWPPQEHGFLEDIDHVITISGNGNPISITAKGGQTIRYTVAVGNWNVKVDDYLEGVQTPISPNGEKIYYATGSNSVDVQAGKTATVIIRMNPICQDCNKYPCECEPPECQCDTEECICGADCNCDCDNCGVIIEYPYIYTVTFDRNGGSGTMADVVYTVGTTYNLPNNTFTYTGHIFAGWNTLADGTGTPYANGVSITDLSTTNGDTVILYAQWTPIYTVTFQTYGGTTLNPITASSIAAEPAATKTNYTFQGWYDNENCTDSPVEFPYAVTANATLYARWSNHYYVNDSAGWNAAVTGIVSSSDLYYIFLNGSFSSASKTFANNVSLTINGNGNTITLTGTGNLLTINNNQKITIQNLTLAGVSNNTAPLVSVSGGGTQFWMMEGSKVINNTNADVVNGDGGGVYVGNSGTFYMAAGSVISGNKSTYFGGGGVYVDGGTFTMHDGTISGNKVDGSTAGNIGGGVYVAGGTFTMYNGTISGNESEYYGGGVAVMGGGTFILEDGTIGPGNTAYSWGGGVFVNSNFTMTGGTIKGNTAGNGGGVGGYYGSGSTEFIKNGGTIYGGNDPDANKMDDGFGNMFGNAVCLDSSPRLIRADTAGATDSCDTSGSLYNPASDGFWD